MTCEPLLAIDPDHDPVALQAVALVELQVRVTAPLTATSATEAVSVAVGAGWEAEDEPLPDDPPPPQAASTKHTGHKRTRTDFGIGTVPTARGEIMQRPTWGASDLLPLYRAGGTIDAIGSDPAIHLAADGTRIGRCTGSGGLV